MKLTIRTATSAAVGVFALLPLAGSGYSRPASPTDEDKSIRPFHISVPQADLDDLRQRVLATRWPEKETVADQSQGVQLVKIQPLVRYWGTDYDWRKAEAKLNALPQFDGAWTTHPT